MALTDDREKTLSKGTQCPSAVLNAIQDAIVALAAGGTGETVEIELGSAPNRVRLKANAPDQLNVRDFADSADGNIKYADDHHGPRIMQLTGGMGHSNFLPYFSAADVGWAIAQFDSAFMNMPFPLHYGDRLLDIEVQQGTTSSVATREMELRYLQDDGGFSAALETVTWGASDSAKKYMSNLGPSNYIMGSDRMYFIRFNEFEDNDTINYVKVTYDRP